MRLEGKRVLITGGGRGIGAATARLLASEGADLVLSARTESQLQAVAAEVQAMGRRAVAVACDVAQEEQVAELAVAAKEALGGIDILINNAGIAVSAPLKGTSLETWNRVMAVNATGVFLCTRALLPGMLERSWGRVINIASVAGKMGAPYISAYAASKHAVIGLTRSLAAEVASKGVTVNAVCPGYVDTPMTDESVVRIQEKTHLDAEQARKHLNAMSPQGRIFSPEEVAYQVLCLADPRSGGVNGQALVLDGGAVQS